MLQTGNEALHLPLWGSQTVTVYSIALPVFLTLAQFRNFYPLLHIPNFCTLGYNPHMFINKYKQLLHVISHFLSLSSQLLVTSLGLQHRPLSQSAYDYCWFQKSCCIHTAPFFCFWTYYHICQGPLPCLLGTAAIAGDHCYLQLLGTIVTSTRFCCHISWGPQSCLLGTIINLVKTTFTSAGNHCHICWVRPLVLCTLWDSKAVQHFEIKFIVSFPVGWNIYMVGSCGGAKTALPCIPKP